MADIDNKNNSNNYSNHDDDDDDDNDDDDDDELSNVSQLMTSETMSKVAFLGTSSRTANGRCEFTGL